MSITTLPQKERCRFDAVRGLPQASRVDRKSLTIRGAKAMQLGNLADGDDRPWKVDEITLDQLSAFVNAKGSGVKMRFSHPNMSRDGMGRHLGRATNARLVEDAGEKYIAVDAKLTQATDGSRTADMVDHVLTLAEQAPEDFGLSIAPLLDHEAMERQKPDKDGRVAIRIKGLQAIDFVDEPAATTGGLFSLDSSDVADLPAQATHLLDTFFAESSAEVIRARFGEFLNQYLRSRGDDMAAETAPPEEPKTPSIEDRLAAIESRMAELFPPKPEEEDDDEKEPEDMERDGDKKMKEEMSAKATAKAELQRRAELSALCKLAKVSDADKQLLIDGGFSRQEAQEWLKTSGHLSRENPPVEEGGNDLNAKTKPEDVFGKEWDEARDVFERQGVTRETYIKSRLRG